jgi:hypothetical protein
MWELWLIGIAAVIIFAEQDVIDRVADVVKTTTAKTRNRELTADEAVKLISPIEIITPKEWTIINQTVTGNNLS